MSRRALHAPPARAVPGSLGGSLGRKLAFSAACLFLAASFVRGGIDRTREFSLLNGSFDSGLASWSTWSSSGQPCFTASSGPAGGLTTAQCSLPAGVQASIWLPVRVGAPGGFAAQSPPFAVEGEKVEFGAWVYLDPNCTTGEVYLELTCLAGSSGVVMAQSDRLQAASAPHGQWLYLRTRPNPLLDGRVPQGAASFDLRLNVDAPGTIWIDEFRGGRFEYAEFGLVNGSFEDPLAPGTWATQGVASLSDPALDPRGYYGKRYLKLSGILDASAAQTLPIGDAFGHPSPTQTTEACAWVYLEDDTSLPVNPLPQLGVELRVSAWTPGAPPNTAQVLANIEWNPTQADRGRWTFLQTVRSASPQIPFDRTHLLVEVEKNLRGTVRVDFVQVGERFAVDGNPRRHVACNYAGWYRSPLFPGATGNPTAPAAIWRNWFWTSPPACDSSSSQFAHNPDCATSPQCYRPNLRRNGAASPEVTIDDLPVAGAYDSRDPDLLRYHAQLARAIGIDSFLFDHNGHKLATQNAMQGIEPLNEQTYAALLDAAEASGEDLKVAVMYEPKVHFNGWVTGEPTLADKKLGIEADLAQLLLTAYDRTCTLKRDGRMVVCVFRNDVCNAAGTQCLQDSDWEEMKLHVEQATGLGLCLVADDSPILADGTSPFSGMSRWNLVTLGILKYQTYGQVAAHQPASPPPTPVDLQTHALSIAAANDAWSELDDSERFGMALAWPGFDDSGVAGWSSANLLGGDGQPLCVRVASDLGGAFYATTWNVALGTRASWIQIATFNDWNEGTQIEPRWNATYEQSALNSIVPPPWILGQVFERAYQTQSAIAAFKGLALGTDLDPARIESLTAAYLRAAAYVPGVTQYD
jgi:hypothetical protein